MIGQTVSHYKILDHLGSGGMGVVYKAHDLKLDRLVAVKFLPPDLTRDSEAKQRFVHEAKAASALDHQNICNIHDIGETDDGQLFIVMAYYEGETLKTKVEQGPLKTEEAIDIAIQVARGLTKAHEHGIVHRDVKPANIMLTADGVVKIVDFGLAKLSGRTMLTKTGSTLGTAAYMSPEQARGDAVDHRTDIWSLGVVLYEMITGRRPFNSEFEQGLIYLILNVVPEPLQGVHQNLKPGVQKILDRALAKQAAERYQTMVEFEEALQTIAGGAMPHKTERTLPKRKQRRRLTYFLSGGVIVMLALMAGYDIGGLREMIFGGTERAGPSIRLAVLPFVNLTGDPEQEYMSDGFTQEMITQLGRLHPKDLSVIARTSVMRYKKGDTPIDQIGLELDVDYLLEGSVRRHANRVRIAAELIKVQGQSQLWADSYERELSVILAVQGDVAQSVTKALALKLLPAAEALLASAPVINAEAYDAVLRGLYHWRKLKASEFETAQRYFELALAKDSSYGPAYSGLSLVWAGRQQMGLMPARDVAPKWKAAALQAVALDNNSGDAHFALAGYLTWYEWDWARAESEWKRAIELNPSDATVQAYYSHFLAITGRLDEAAIHIELGLKLDPFNELLHGLHAAVLNYLDRYEESAAAARTALSMQPDAPVAFSQLEIALGMLGRHDEILALQRERYAQDPERLEALERGIAEAGYKGAMRRVADVLAARFEHSPARSGTTYIARKYLEGGDKDRAIYWLEMAYENRDGNLPYIGRPLWNPLLSDSRFPALLRKLNLPMATGGSR
jgi:TolB-like protein